VCKTTYEEIKKDKKHRYVVFFIRDEKQIDVEVIGKTKFSYIDGTHLLMVLAVALLWNVQSFHSSKHHMPAPQGATGYFKVLFFSFNLCVWIFQTTTRLLGQKNLITICHNYLINGSGRYLFWPRGAVQKLPRH